MQISILDLRPQFNSLKDEILKEIAEVCESQRFILGPKVENFEAMMNDYCHTAATVGVTSGSDALIISLMAEGIGPGDEVIAPTFTFFATAGAIARVGATPVFADIDPVTFNLDPADFERKITPKTINVPAISIGDRKTVSTICSKKNPTIKAGTVAIHK